MDLVLLKPGNEDIITGDTNEGGSLIVGPLAGVDIELNNCMELVSMHFGMKQQVTTDVSNSARTSGRPNLHDITAVKYFDKTSPKLYKHCLSAMPLDDGQTPTEIYICRNSGHDDPEENTIANIMTIQLFNAIVSSIESQSHPDDMATEQFTINYTAITWTYTVQNSDVSLGGNVSYGWNVAQNRYMAATL